MCWIFSIENLTRGKRFEYEIKLLKPSSLYLADILSKCYKHQKTNWWKMTTARGKKLFYDCVACVCFTFGTIFLAFEAFMANVFMMGLMTISFALPIDLCKPLWNWENGLCTKSLFLKTNKKTMTIYKIVYKN